MNSLLNVIWSQRRHEAKPEIRLFRTQFKSFLPVWTPMPNVLYSVSFTFIEPWYHKNGTVKRKDVPNLVKSCLDALMERYSLDDCYIWNLTCHKVHRLDRPGIHVTLLACGSTTSGA